MVYSSDCSWFLKIFFVWLDNKFNSIQFIGRTMREFWRKKKMKTLIPLRRWEVNKGFKEWKTKKCTVSTWEVRATTPNIFQTSISVYLNIFRNWPPKLNTFWPWYASPASTKNYKHHPQLEIAFTCYLFRFDYWN